MTVPAVTPSKAAEYFVKNLKAILATSGVTPDQLSDSSGIPMTRLSEILLTKRDPSLDESDVIFRALTPLAGLHAYVSFNAMFSNIFEESYIKKTVGIFPNKRKEGVSV